MMKSVLRTFCGVILGLFLTAPAFAQLSTAQLAGKVTDTSGGVLPGATVTTTQAETGATRSVVTDGDGAYVVSNLSPGPYRLEVSLQGFRTYAQTGIVLQVAATPTINVSLALGDLQETVTVEAAAPLVDVKSAGVSEVVESERIVELPLQGRDVTSLLVLAGASVNTGSPNSRSFAGGVNVAVAGGLPFGVAYLLDGAMHNDSQNNANLPLPFPDALQEFRVATTGLTAQNGMHSGASVNAITKSGTNRFSGNLFEFNRDRRFNATDPFARVVNGKRVDDGLSRNQWGGTVGGPIGRDRPFFFGAYQGTNVHQIPAGNIAFVPTDAMLRGDFTAFASAACNGGTPLTLRAPFVNNQVIEPDRLRPAPVEQKPDQYISVTSAWNMAAPAGGAPGAPPAAQPQPAAVEERTMEIWSTPQGFVKAALANNATSQPSGSGSEVTFTSGKTKYVGTINAQNQVEKVQTWINNPVLGDTLVETTFSDYRDFNGIQFPSHIVRAQGGYPVLDLAVSSVTSNGAVDLTAPEEARNATVPPVNVTVEKLADGVYYLKGGTHHSLAIDQRDHIVIVEGPQDEARSLAVIAKAKETIPNKPIRYVINTHAHFDHSGGLRTYVDEGATIVTSEMNRSYSEKAWSAPHALNPDRLEQSKKTATFETFSDKHVVTDGRRSIEIYPIQSSGHNDSFMMVYLPREKILAEADAFTPAAADAPPPATPNPFSVNLYDNIQRLKLDVRQIAALHGPRLTTMADLRAAIGQKTSATNLSGETAGRSQTRDVVIGAPSPALSKHASLFEPPIRDDVRFADRGRYSGREGGSLDMSTAPVRHDLYGGRSPREIAIYSPAEAAHYLRIPENTIRSWIRGRLYPTSRGHRRALPVVPPAHPERGLSFINLLELHVLGAIRRQHQVDMKNVRAATEFLKNRFGSEHPLVDEEMDTDGKHLFVRKYGSLINASKQGQGAMEAVLDAHLKRIQRDEQGLAVRLFPFTRKGIDAPRIVAIDPLVAFGRPVIIGSRIPTSDVADRFKAGESPADLAYDYGRPQAEIEEAIRCELGTAA